MHVNQKISYSRHRLFVKHIAVPNEHGSWVFLFSPLLIGLFAGEKFSTASLLLVGAVLSAFMLRQPVTILVKILSNRRPRNELTSSLFWITVYGILGVGFFSGLVWIGYTALIYLVVPALPVFGWHLWLVSKRSERRKPLVEIAGSGALALAAPGAYWVGIGQYDSIGWLLWGLCWLQAATSILYAYLRLEQRGWPAVPSVLSRWKAGRKIVAYAGFAAVLVSGLAIFKIVPVYLPLAFTIQLIEAIYGTFLPAVKVKPTLIGIRQLIISSIFTILFILLW